MQFAGEMFCESDYRVSAAINSPVPIQTVFRKTGSPAALKEEWARMSQAAKVGEDTGWFKVPRVLQFIESEGRLDLECIADLVTMRILVLEGHPRLYQLLEMTGRALGGVHERLQLSRQEAVPLGLGFQSKPEDEVFVHGDFTADNVGWSQSLDTVYILDWSTAPLFHGVGNKATRYFDLVWFSFYLFASSHQRGFGFRNGANLVKPFLNGYARTGQRFEPDSFRRTARAMREYLRVALDGHSQGTCGLRKWASKISAKIMWLKWNRYIAE